MKTRYPLGPAYLSFTKIDSNWCLAQAQHIVRSFSVTQSGSSSGKFYDNYNQYLFHIESEHPLISRVRELIIEHQFSFEQVYKRPLKTEWVYLSCVKSGTGPICIPHLDGYWMNGQLHLTIQGQSCIHYWKTSPYEDDSVKPQPLIFDNGSFWYLNGSEYYHSIFTPNKNQIGKDRFELLVPVEPRNLEDYKHCLSNCRFKYVDSQHPEWKKIKERQIMRQKESYKKKIASSPSSVGYVKGINEN